MIYEDASLDNAALQLANDLSDILKQGSGLREPIPAYVNYADGFESLEELYGQQHIAKLKRLKREYDPHGKFTYYNPIS